jgi:hypothetical protein
MQYQQMNSQHGPAASHCNSATIASCALQEEEQDGVSKAVGTWHHQRTATAIWNAQYL